MSSSRKGFFVLIVNAIASTLNRQRKEPKSLETNGKDVRRIDSTSHLKAGSQQGVQGQNAGEITRTDLSCDRDRETSVKRSITAYAVRLKGPEPKKQSNILYFQWWMATIAASGRTRF